MSRSKSNEKILKDLKESLFKIGLYIGIIPVIYLYVETSTTLVESFALLIGMALFFCIICTYGCIYYANYLGEKETEKMNKKEVF